MAKMKGLAHEKMMPNMSTYGGQENPGYKPPQGSAGKSAKGAFSHDSNPLSVPKKGSEIGAGYGNSDRLKAMKNKDFIISLHYFNFLKSPHINQSCMIQLEEVYLLNFIDQIKCSLKSLC